MPAGTVVAAWEANGAAHLSVRVVEVRERDGQKNVEYIGSVPLAALDGLTAPQRRTKLVDAVKAVRDAQLPTHGEVPWPGQTAVAL